MNDDAKKITVDLEAPTAAALELTGGSVDEKHPGMKALRALTATTRSAGNPKLRRPAPPDELSPREAAAFSSGVQRGVDHTIDLLCAALRDAGLTASAGWVRVAFQRTKVGG